MVLGEQKTGGCTEMIKVDEVSKSYGDVAALAGASCVIADGETLGITGPSGSGKTTLLRLLAGLETPDSGEIRFDGEVYSTPRKVVAPSLRGIGLVFQEPALWPHMTVAQNILFGLDSVARSEAVGRMQHLLDALDIEQLHRRRPSELSAGQARRVALARALAPRPRYILMDEPLVNLEIELKERMLQLIRAELQATGASLVFVSHDTAEVAQITNRQLLITDGKLGPAEG